MMIQNITKKPMIALIVMTLLSLIQTPSYAGTGSGKVGNIYVHVGDIVMFSVDNHDSPPACSGVEWAFSLQDETGKAVYKLLLTAKALGRDVYVFGFNDCAVWPDRERPIYIIIQ